MDHDAKKRDIQIRWKFLEDEYQRDKENSNPNENGTTNYYKSLLSRHDEKRFTNTVPGTFSVSLTTSTLTPQTAMTVQNASPLGPLQQGTPLLGVITTQIQPSPLPLVTRSPLSSTPKFYVTTSASNGVISPVFCNTSSVRNIPRRLPQRFLSRVLVDLKLVTESDTTQTPTQAKQFTQSSTSQSPLPLQPPTPQSPSLPPTNQPPSMSQPCTSIYGPSPAPSSSSICSSSSSSASSTTSIDYSLFAVHSSNYCPNAKPYFAEQRQTVLTQLFTPRERMGQNVNHWNK